MRVAIALTLCAFVAVAFARGGGGGGGRGGGGRRGGYERKIAKDIPECKDYIGQEGLRQKTTPNCNEEVVACFRGAHRKAKHCVGKEMRKQREAGEKARKCFKDARPAMKEWFRLSCLWHMAVDKCMAGDDAAGKFLVTVGAGGEELTREQHLARLRASECWAEVHKKTDACYEMVGEGCANYKTCSGREPPASNDARLDKWYKSVKALGTQKRQQSKKMHDEIKSCIEA